MKSVASKRHQVKESISSSVSDLYRTQLRKIRDNFFKSMIKAPLAMARFDKKMNYLFATERWISDYGLTEKKIIGKNHYKIFPELPGDLKEIHRRVFRGEVLRGREYTFVRKNGNIDYVNWIALTWYDLNHQIKGIDILSEVVTARIEAERELKKIKKHFDSLVNQETLRLQNLLEYEKKIGQMKSDLLSLAAHEFRTPLGVILLSSQLLQLDLDRGNKDKFLLHLDVITKAARSIRETINDFFKRNLFELILLQIQS